MSDLCLDNSTSLTPSVRDVALSKHRSLIYIGPQYIREVTLSTHRSLIYIHPKCQRRRII
jgi:hypothetical protein